MTQAWKRWVPAAIIPAVIAAAALAVPLAANADATLPAKSPAEVLAMVAKSDVRALSGTVEQTSNLGLPDAGSLGSSATSDESSVLELLTGSHTARVYLDGPTKARIQLLDNLAERDLIRSGNDVWLYSSKDNTATHITLPAREDKKSPAEKKTPTEAPTPSALAEKFLSAVDPTTTVSLGEDVTVAGRSAYDLVLKPRSSETLVGSVSIAVDSKTGLPLRVEVTARGEKDAAVSVGFTSLSLDTPSASLFAFTPPKGATVEQQKLPTAAPKAEKHSDVRPAVTGTGWASVVEVPSSATGALGSSALLDQLSTPVAGGRLLHTSLVNILLTTDGRIFAGSVPVDQLQAAAAAK